MIPRSTIPRSSMRWSAIASISARSDRKKTHGASSRTPEGTGRRRIQRCRAFMRRSGCDIGAVSPPEIAVSIMGEITARLRLEPKRGCQNYEVRRRCPGSRRKAASSVHSIRTGGLRAQEGHGGRQVRNRRAQGRRHCRASRSRGLSPATCLKMMRRAISRRRWRARVCASTSAFTGRCNLFAETAGVLVVDHAGDRPPQ